ncbi:unnamed protein product [Heligmosomoides polygyrus]|uniref:Uncharacterized protein n=1 Tax=Heligmosomoides polygyrus TaxID=6339 RepID=A0A183FZX3_HELPZ|nr:unnamed protein product [Heligmosomoides polygyrus]
MKVKKTEYLTTNDTESSSIKINGIELPHRKIPERLKPKIYTALVRPVAMYGAECSPGPKEAETRLSVTETKTLRWTAGVLAWTACETMSFGRSSVSRRRLTKCAKLAYDGTATFYVEKKTASARQALNSR